MADVTIDPHETVSIEQDGRILAGSGVSEEVIQSGFYRGKTPQPESEDHESTDVAPLEGQPETPKPSRGQKRFSQLTSERDKARQEATEAQRRAEELANRIATLEAAVANRPEEPEPEIPQAPELRAKPSVSEIGTKYPDYESYVEDLADWKAEQRELKLREEFDARFEARIEAERASRTQQTQADTVLSRGRAAYADFDAVIAQCPVQFPEGMLKAILALPNAEHIEYQLASDPQLAQEIAQIPDGLSLGLRLAQLVPTGGRVTPASRPPVARTSQAPTPYEPVRGESQTTSPPLADLAASGNYEAYKARRQAERERARR